MLELAAGLAQRGTDVQVSLTLPGLIALGAGVLILIFPRILNYVVAGYLILVGVIEIFNLNLWAARIHQGGGRKRWGS